MENSRTFIVLIAFKILAVSSQITGPSYGPGLGFPNLNCPSVPNGPVLISCQRDCEENHNARYGFCGNATQNDFSCYCSQPLRTLQSISRQCVDRRFKRQYDDICRTDCLCDHGAVNYYCNYQTHACECKGQSLDRTLCPHKTLRDLVLSVVRHKLPGFPTETQVLGLLGLSH